MKLPETSAFPTTGKKGGKRKKAGPPAWIFRRKPRICSRKILILPFYGKGIYGKSFWILRSKKPANPHEYWQKRGGHLKCPPQMVGEGGFEPPKSLTTDLQSAPFGHSGILPYKAWIQAFLTTDRENRGASGRTKTQLSPALFSSATQRLRLSVPASPLFAKNAAQRHFLTLKPS